MNVSCTRTRRLMMAGTLAAAMAVPTVAALLAAPSTHTPLASCPPGQTLDVLTGTCSPDVHAPEPVTNPINPEEATLQPGSITSAENGEVGRLPEVNGIPCNGDNTGLCIGLTQINEQLGVTN